MGEETVESNGRDGLVCVSVLFRLQWFCFALSVLFACFSTFSISSKLKTGEKNAGKKKKRKEKRARYFARIE